MRLLVTEDGSQDADELWETAEELFSSRVTYVEARSALARGRRAGRLSRGVHVRARAELDAQWFRVDVVELDHELAVAAGDATEGFGLRAYDAVHLASALEVGDRELVFASWDDRLRQAAVEAGLFIAPAT